MRACMAKNLVTSEHNHLNRCEGRESSANLGVTGISLDKHQRCWEHLGEPLPLQAFLGAAGALLLCGPATTAP